MSKRIARWNDTPAPKVEPGAVMLDPVSGCEVRVRRVAPQLDGVVIEYEASPAGVGYFAQLEQIMRTRKVEADVV